MIKKEMTLMNHKKTLASLLMLFVLAFSVILPAAQPEDAAAADIQVIVNGQYLNTDQPPEIQDGRTMVPLRAIFEALGAQVEYFADTRTVSGYDPQTNRIMSLVLDQKTLFCADYTLFQVYEANPTSQAAINFVLSHTKEIDVPATSIGGRTMVPARVIAESLGASVVWDGNTRVVTITR